MTRPETPIARRKRELRRESRAGMIALSADQRRIDPEMVLDRLAALSGAVRGLVVFAYLADEGEIDLDPTIERLLHAGSAVAVPAVDATVGVMTPVRLMDLGNPSRDRYGLRTPPTPHREIPLAEIDVALIPGVAFTAAGDRLGRGGGYYDRLLARLPRSVRRIGICHSIQVRETLPGEDHDVAVDELLVRA
ncbi:MAG: 5-formyltetrahydrofolate cyclo-ligase [Planctomycetota bacterium]|nr:5-formyltetrahydrofolate cyclo-ligase [Planctomycetota bacterium]